MRSIIFDTSSIISLAINNMLWTLEHLKKQFDGKFFITESVHKELVDNPLRSKRYKLEALMIQDVIENRIIEVYPGKNLEKDAKELLSLLNHVFSVRDSYIKILDMAEVESLVLAKELGSRAYIVDERTIRLVVENPPMLASLLKDKLHTKIDISYKNLENIRNWFKAIKILRSVELMLIAYKMKLFDNYLQGNKNKRYDFVDGMLWALKLHGCSITENEIHQILNSDII
ncbi:hypothetical protein HYX18_04790 [Candidatus Woesearchaeota archaeon]|nr:hypothetical protein [Candidatus Woesearchaeota archaeon]